MLELSASVVGKRNLLRSGRTVEVESTLRAINREIGISPLAITRFVDRLFANSPEIVPEVSKLPKENGNGETSRRVIDNVRGRPPETFSSRQAGNDLDGMEELFSSEGVILALPKNEADAEENASKQEEQPFHFNLRTRFHNFRGSKSIVHEVHSNSNNQVRQLLPEVEAKAVGRLVPIRLDQVRIGFEQYSSRMLGSLIGVMPTIERRLYLEISHEAIRIYAKDEAIVKKDVLPLEKQGFMFAIDKTLSETGLFSGFCEKLRAQLA